MAEIGDELRREVGKVVEKATSREKRSLEFLTVRETARLLRVDPKTVRRWIAEGVLPAPIRLGGAVRFRRDDLDEWLERAARGGEQGA